MFALLSETPTKRPDAQSLLLHSAFFPKPRLRQCVLVVTDACEGESLRAHGIGGHHGADKPVRTVRRGAGQAG